MKIREQACDSNIVISKFKFNCDEIDKSIPCRAVGTNCLGWRALPCALPALSHVLCATVWSASHLRPVLVSEISRRSAARPIYD